MYIMQQKSIFKSSIWKVFEVFVDEPLKIHYVKEISKKIILAPTSVKNHLIELEKEKIIIQKKGERFTGYIANRDNDSFLFYKKIFNLIKIKESKLLDHIKEILYPNAIILYGSFLRGEDVEKSDIDIFITSKSKKDFNLEKFEKILKRNIHLIIEEDINKLNENLKLEIINGLILDGYLKYGR
jgi:predicted nucleotidyltransferase